MLFSGSSFAASSFVRKSSGTPFSHASVTGSMMPVRRNDSSPSTPTFSRSATRGDTSPRWIAPRLPSSRVHSTRTRPALFLLTDAIVDLPG